MVQEHTSYVCTEAQVHVHLGKVGTCSDLGKTCCDILPDCFPTYLTTCTYMSLPTLPLPPTFNLLRPRTGRPPFSGTSFQNVSPTTTRMC